MVFAWTVLASFLVWNNGACSKTTGAVFLEHQTFKAVPILGCTLPPNTYAVVQNLQKYFVFFQINYNKQLPSSKVLS
eukprot:6062639-Amphidinium_carterae.1